jgi:hypothetical protein
VFNLREQLAAGTPGEAVTRALGELSHGLVVLLRRDQVHEYFSVAIHVVEKSKCTVVSGSPCRTIGSDSTSHTANQVNGSHFQLTSQCTVHGIENLVSNDIVYSKSTGLEWVDELPRHQIYQKGLDLRHLQEGGNRSRSSWQTGNADCFKSAPRGVG